MKINCLSCGHTIDLDDAYSDYEGQIKCYTCNALLEVKLSDSLIKSVKLYRLDSGQARNDKEATVTKRR